MVVEIRIGKVSGQRQNNRPPQMGFPLLQNHFRFVVPHHQQERNQLIGNGHGGKNNQERGAQIAPKVLGPPPDQQACQSHREQVHGGAVQGGNRHAHAFAIGADAPVLARPKDLARPHRRQPPHQEPQVRGDRAQHQQYRQQQDPCNRNE